MEKWGGHYVINTFRKPQEMETNANVNPLTDWMNENPGLMLK